MLRRKTERSRRKSARSRRFQLEKLEQRQLLAANPIGVTPFDTGEFLLGTVGVTPVFFESNGTTDPSTEDWTPEEIDQVLDKVAQGVNWWSDTLDALDTVHTLDFVIDDTYAVDPVETRFEPITRTSSAFNLYIGDFVTSLGYGDSNSIEEAVQRFNHDQREKLQTDWSFTIFVVDSSNDDGLFAPGGPFAGAFAFAGGLFFVVPSTRPVSTFTHELGHIFWARDEYAGSGSWTDQRGYYNAQNLNAADNSTPGFQQEISIMRGGVPLQSAFEANVSPESTLAMIGWRDSDGDGVFDLADVPLHLDGTGYFDAATSSYRFQGSASAVPLINQNSSGPQSDITLNRISQLQYRLDDGPWMVAAEPDQQVAELDVSFTISEPFSTIQWRVIDLPTGITSAIIEGTSTLPAIPAASASGIAFVDANANGRRDESEAALAGTQINVRNGDGSNLFAGGVQAEDFGDGPLNGLSGVTLSADGVVFDPEVASFESNSLENQRVFQAFDQQGDRWVDRWSSKVALEATFDTPVGEVSLEAIGITDGTYARVEAYDAAGVLLTRVTTDSLAEGQTATVSVSDSLGRIASIRAFGHANSFVAFNGLQFGSSGSIVTDASGGWKINNLPDGTYVVELIPEKVIHQFDRATFEIEVVAGSSDWIDASAQRVDSPRFNAALPNDSNQDGIVTSRDALVIINDLNRFSPRVLQSSETSGFDIDVSNDGSVTALDALLVINSLTQENGQEGESGVFLAMANSPASTASSAEFAGPILNSGGKTSDESMEQLGTDTTDQSGIAPEKEGKIADFATGSPESVLAMTQRSDDDPTSATKTEGLINLNPPEISEPFRRSAI